MGLGIIQKLSDGIGLTDYAGAARSNNAAKANYRKLAATGDEMMGYWRDTASPFQKQLLDRSGQLWDDANLTDADYSQALGASSADVVKAYQAVRDANARRQARYGINPAAEASLGVTSGNSEAATLAASRNATRRNLRQSEFANKATALGIGNGVNASGMAMPGTAMSGYSGSANGLAGIGASQQASSDAILGAVIKGGASAIPIPKADGGEVPRLGVRRALMQPPGEVDGPGGPVDDAIPAALSDGEVVLPTDTVTAIGEEALRANPREALHRLGVRVLQDKIDATHTPAALQRQGDNDGDEPMEGEMMLADGGEAEGDWTDTALKWGKVLGEGYLNGVSKGGWLEGRELARQNKAKDEAAARQKELERRTDEQYQRGEDYRKALADNAVKAMPTYTGDDRDAIDDPEFGVAQNGVTPEQRLGIRGGPINNQAFLAATDEDMAKNDPLKYAELLRARQAAADALKLKQAEKEDERAFLLKRDAAKLKGNTSAEGEKPNVVRMKTGKRMTEQAVQGMYAKEWGATFDDLGNVASWKPDRPNYEKWRNDMVDPEYAISYDQREKMAPIDAQKKAKEEADALSDGNPFSEAEFGPGGRKAWEEKRAKELQWGTSDKTSSAPAKPAPTLGAKPPKETATKKSAPLKSTYKHSSGKTVTRQQIEETARNRGMTVDEVIQKLGLK